MTSDNLIEARRSIRDLIKLEAQKIAKLIDLDQALEQEFYKLTRKK